MTAALLILGSWLAVSALACLLLGAVVRRADERLEPLAAPTARAPLAPVVAERRDGRSAVPAQGPRTPAAELTA